MIRAEERTEVDDSPGLHAHVSGAFRLGTVMKKKPARKATLEPN